MDKKIIALERGKRVKLARQISNLTRKDMSQRYNINENTLHAWEKGVNYLTDKKASLLVNAFADAGLNITLDWLLYGYDASLSGNLFSEQLSTNNKNEELRDIVGLQNDMKFFDEIRYFRSIYPQSAVTMITDDSLLPIFNLGDYVGGVYNSLPASKLVNNFCLITTNDNPAPIATKIFQHIEDREFIVGYINPLTTRQGPSSLRCSIKKAAKITRHWISDQN